jgi:tetratricopeptide (TPR) repeat protein
LLPAIQAAVDRGAGPEALELCDEALAVDAHDADAHRQRALLLAAAGRDREAVASAQRACELLPQDPRAASDLGRVHAMRERFELAARCFQQAVTLDRRFADGWHNLGTALRRLGRAEDAFAALKHALLLDGSRANTCLNMGALLIDSQQLDDALECFERAARLDPTLALAQSRLAAQLAARGKLRRAEGLFRQSVTLDPRHTEGWLGLGQALEDLGDAEGALGCYRNVLAREAGHAVALGRQLALLRGAAAPGLLQAARMALDDPHRTDEGRALIGYGLAKYHDRRAEHAAAASAGIAANHARQRSAGSFDRAAFDARVDAIIRTCDADFFHARRGFGLGTDQPVFIVGLPRSGTTLTEQIIASHPMFHGAGELPDLPRIAAGVVPEAPWTASSRIDDRTSRELGFTYLEALRDGAPRGCLRITDKAPFNFFQLGLAALLFPQARVIHCRRGARDNALSIWMENFNSDQHYATDFGDLAHLRAGYERLMAHWRTALPLRILDLDYEALVADLEAGARRMVAFLDAPWDRRCLDFHESGRAVQTPSRWQVRQRIYTGSVGRWKSYAPYLSALEEAFPA